MRYIQRSLEPVVLRAAAQFPCVVVTGPRQSGKTTMLRKVLSGSHGYVSLEPPDIRASAAGDPRGFLALHGPPVVLDEIQYAPDLLPYIKEAIDADRDRPGQFVLTGSQNLLLAEGVTESLAGRAAMLRLLPLSDREAAGVPDAPLAWETDKPPRARPGTQEELWQGFLRGGYPELVADPDRDLHLWYSSYVQTYLERDVRSVREIGDLQQFQTFLRALAARSARLLNMAELSRDLGVAVNTVKAWLSVLEATYQVIVLRPYFANIGKRLVKTPKVYIADVGMLCHLTGLREPEHAMAGPMGGAIFETAVVTEAVRTLTHRGIEPQIYFWRTGTGVEVNLLVDTGPVVVPIEAKLSATPRPQMARSIRALQQDLGQSAADGYVVHPGEITLPLGGGVTALPFRRL